MEIHNSISDRDLQELLCERDTYAELLARLIRLQCPEFATCCEWGSDRDLVNAFIGQHDDGAFDALRGEL
jgi:hypothetical protein